MIQTELNDTRNINREWIDIFHWAHCKQYNRKDTGAAFSRANAREHLPTEQKKWDQSYCSVGERSWTVALLKGRPVYTASFEHACFNMHVKTCRVNTVKSRLLKHVCLTWGIEHVLFDKSWHGLQINQWELRLWGKVKIVKSHQQARVDETKTKEVNKIKNASKERWTVPNKSSGVNSQKITETIRIFSSITCNNAWWAPCWLRLCIQGLIHCLLRPCIFLIILTAFATIIMHKVATISSFSIVRS